MLVGPANPESPNSREITQSFSLKCCGQINFQKGPAPLPKLAGATNRMPLSEIRVSDASHQPVLRKGHYVAAGGYTSVRQNAQVFREIACFCNSTTPPLNDQLPDVID